MTTDQRPERRETEEERLEREAREAEEARARRAAQVAAMSVDELRRDATDDDLKAETARLARPDPRENIRLRPQTTLRATGHARIDAAREQVQRAAAGAIIHAARDAAKPEGPTLADLLHAHAVSALAAAPDSFWTALHAAVDAPAPRGMSEVFSEVDEVAEARALTRAREERRAAIHEELEVREFVRRAKAQPRIVERIAKLAKDVRP